MLARFLVVLVLLAGVAAAGDLRYPQLPPLKKAPRDPHNPPTPAKRNLGAELFFDQRLSTSGVTSCANCHVHNTSWQDNLVKPRPDTSQGGDFFTLAFNTDSLLNIVHRRFFFRDGRTQDLGHAFTEPWIEENQRLGTTRPEAATKLAAMLREKPGWVQRFRRAFDVDIRTLPDEEVFDLAGDALAVFARQLVTRPSPFDRWNARRGSLSEAAIRGAALFTGKARCVQCHYGPNLTDQQFHNVSTSPPDATGVRADEGRAKVTGNPADGGRFLTPTLRQVTATSPYFHAGQANTIFDVISHFDANAGVDPNHDPVFDTPLGLTQAEKYDLYQFLESLRGPMAKVRGPTGLLCDDAAVARLRAQLP